MEKKYKGMIVEVFRAADGMDCSINGISSRYTQVLLVGEDIPEIFSEREGLPVVKLVKRVIFGNPYMHVQPVDGVGYSFGGNFCYTSDSRFPNDYPLAIHDRQEGRG